MEEKIKKAIKRYLVESIILFCIFIYHIIMGADGVWLGFILMLIFVEQINHNSIVEKRLNNEMETNRAKIS